MRKEIQGRNGTNRPQSYRTSDVAVTSIDSTNGVAENWIKTKKIQKTLSTSSNPTITRKTITNTKTGINTCIFHTSILSVDIHHSSLNNSSNILDNFQSLWAITFFYPFIVFYLPEDANVGFSQVQQLVLVSIMFMCLSIQES